MEGKAALFKRFADIDSIDLEIDTRDVDQFVNCVRYLHPAFGGINLEDIKAPECFIIEERLRELLDIPVFHDDQHGTAIIAAAGLINALHLTGRTLEQIKMVINGAGAASIACVELLEDDGPAAGERHPVRHPRRHLSRPHRRHEPVEVGARGRDPGTHPRPRRSRARTCSSACRPRGRSTRRWSARWRRQADHLRDGQPRPGDHPRGGAGGAFGRDHRHRALRLSQPGQQCPGFPLHLPRRARRARLDDQRGDEDRRGRGAGRVSRARTCPTRSPPPIRASG